MGSLPDYVDMEVTATLKKQISDILVDNSDPANRIKFYDDWCDKYDEDLVVVGNYTGHTKCVEAFLQLELNRNIAVLDLACGTGLLGAEVTTDHHILSNARRCCSASGSSTTSASTSPPWPRTGT